MQSGQSGFFRGIYEFEDPSGELVCAKIPRDGSASLYDGTAVLVRPGQIAVFVYKGRVADILKEGLHYLKTENLPILTNLAQFKFGLVSPLRCEIWFFSTTDFYNLRWGVAQEIVTRQQDHSMMSLRTSGSFAFTIIDPVSFLLRVVGSKALYTVEKVEELIEGLIQEAVQGVFSQATSFDELLDEKLEIAEEVSLRVSDILQPLGLKMHTFQIYSILPAQEVLDALHAKMAMQIVGDPVDYILYQAGKTFEKRPQLSNVLLRDTADLLAFANNRSAIPNQQSATSTEDSSTQKSQVSKIKKAR